MPPDWRSQAWRPKMPRPRAGRMPRPALAKGTEATALPQRGMTTRCLRCACVTWRTQMLDESGKEHLAGHVPVQRLNRSEYAGLLFKVIPERGTVGLNLTAADTV